MKKLFPGTWDTVQHLNSSKDSFKDFLSYLIPSQNSILIASCFSINFLNNLPFLILLAIFLFLYFSHNCVQNETINHHSSLSTFNFDIIEWSKKKNEESHYQQHCSFDWLSFSIRRSAHNIIWNACYDPNIHSFILYWDIFSVCFFLF